MISLRIASWLLLAIGTISAGTILASSFHSEPATTSITLWILTVGGFAAGLILPAIADPAERYTYPLSATGGTALLLGIGSLIAILVDAVGLVPVSSTTNLWLLAGGGLVIGPIALASARALKEVPTH